MISRMRGKHSSEFALFRLHSKPDKGVVLVYEVRFHIARLPRSFSVASDFVL
jgi:hypothetical protein